MSDTIKSVDVPSVHGMVVLNPDGTNIGSTAPSSLPTAGNNPSTVYAYDGNGDLASITKTIGATQYQKTFTMTDGVLTASSEWVEV